MFGCLGFRSMLPDVLWGHVCDMLWCRDVRALWRSGVDVAWYGRRVGAWARRYQRRYPLGAACMWRHVLSLDRACEVMNRLLYGGLDVNVRMYRRGTYMPRAATTVLHVAVHAGARAAAVLRLCLAHGADVARVDWIGKTVVHEMCEVPRLVLEVPLVDVEAWNKTWQGVLPLQLLLWRFKRVAMAGDVGALPMMTRAFACALCSGADMRRRCFRGIMRMNVWACVYHTLEEMDMSRRHVFGWPLLRVLCAHTTDRRTRPFLNVFLDKTWRLRPAAVRVLVSRGMYARQTWRRAAAVGDVVVKRLLEEGELKRPSRRARRVCQVV